MITTGRDRGIGRDVALEVNSDVDSVLIDTFVSAFDFAAFREKLSRLLALRTVALGVRYFRFAAYS